MARILQKTCEIGRLPETSSNAPPFDPDGGSATGLFTEKTRVADKEHNRQEIKKP
jgi:hypothetical protein